MTKHAHGGHRPLPLRTIEQWMTPRLHSNRRYKGVSRRGSEGTWRASLCVSKKLHFLGNYKTEKEAAAAVRAFILRTYTVLPTASEE